MDTENGDQPNSDEQKRNNNNDDLEKKKKPACCNKKYEFMPNRMEITRCEKIYPPHPCDPVRPCDPCKEPEGECNPAVCLEKIKNPAFPHENTRCRTGEFLKVQACKRPDPPHPCDTVECIPGFRKKQKCPPAALCWHRIKNPEEKKPIVCPNNTYEAPLPKQPPCSSVKKVCKKI